MSRKAKIKIKTPSNPPKGGGKVKTPPNLPTGGGRGIGG